MNTGVIVGRGVPIVWAGLAVLLLCLPALARRPHYTLRVWLTSINPAAPVYNPVVRVYDLRTGSVVFTRTLRGMDVSAISPKDFYWSADRRAVAFSGGTEPGHGARFFTTGVSATIWRAKECVRQIVCRVVNCARPQGNDYTEDMAWSPDDNYLLVRGGSSGEDTIGNGRVYCLDINRGVAYYVGWAGGRPRWIGPRTVEFWPGVYYNGDHFIHPHDPSFWRLPRTRSRLRSNNALHRTNTA